MTLPLACSMADPLDGLWFLAREFMGPRASKECAARLARGDNHLREGRAAVAEKKLQGGNGFPLAAGPRRSRWSTTCLVGQAMVHLHKLSDGAPGPALIAGTEAPPRLAEPQPARASIEHGHVNLSRPEQFSASGRPLPLDAMWGARGVARCRA